MKNERVLDMESLDYLYGDNKISSIELDESSKEEEKIEIKRYEEKGQYLFLEKEVNEKKEDIDLEIENEQENLMVPIPLFNQDKKSNNFIPQKETSQILYKNKFNIYNENGLFKKRYSDNKNKNEKVGNNNLFNVNKSTSTAKLFKTRKKEGKIIRKRKEKPDDIRKKIKSRFLKTLKNGINRMLENANSKMFFDYLPQSFVVDVSRQANKPIMNMKLKDLLLFECVYNYVDYQKYEHNIEVIDYLNKNPDVCKNSNFHIISEMTFSELFNEYLHYEDYKLELENLKKIELESDEYIQNYKYLAETFISYYSK